MPQQDVGGDRVGGRSERWLPVGIQSVDVCATLDKMLNDPVMACGRRSVQGGAAKLVGGCDAGLPLPEEQHCGLGGAARCHDERRVTVTVAHVE